MMEVDSVPDYIVAIGGSAGGFEAFEGFLSRMPSDTGMAFIIIQHLDPTRESHLAKLLQRATVMPVRQAVDRMIVEPNAVYVVPQNTDPSLDDGHIRLIEPSLPHGLRKPIDSFFCSLSAAQGDKSVGIIVSGMGTDGTLGLKAIKEVSGLVMAQDPDTTEFDSMPRSAIGTGQVDCVASIDELPKRLTELVAARLQREKDERDRVSDTALLRILELLRAHTTHDFSLYKKSTIHRRTAKRIRIVRAAGISEYASYVEEHLEELDALFRTLLIGVTGFFRDPGAFDYLERNVLPELVKAVPQGSAVRVWVPGCSTGEEAYSISIIFQEVVDRLRPDSDLKIQIFATDIDDQAIAIARKGFYPANVMACMSSERLKRYFTAVEGGYIAKEQIRKTLVFALHNLLNNPPLSKMHLISCRNLMIYFGPELQRRIVPLFHYALNPDGILFLGTAESTGASRSLFTSVESKWKIYRRKETETRPVWLCDIPAGVRPNV